MTVSHRSTVYALRVVTAAVLTASLCGWASGQTNPNRVPNPLLGGVGGIRQNVSGQVPDRWRGFAVGGGAAQVSIVPLPAHELYAGSPACNAVRLKVTAFGTDQGIDHYPEYFPVSPSESYRLEFWVKTGNADGSPQLFRTGFPLFVGTTYLGREPGAQNHLTATSTWTRITGPLFSDPQASQAHVSFRVYNDGGENSIMIALPAVGDPPPRFPPWPAADLVQRPSWTPTDRIVGTTYFYWYRWPDMHFFDDAAYTDDALTTHFIDPLSVSMLSTDWHRGQLLDMIEAGIDTVWPVYWAAPGNFDHPQYKLYVYGLLKLQEARDALVAQGLRPPRIGMFYDTTSLWNLVRGASPWNGYADLTTPAGRDIFYGTIRSFWATVHPRHWACIDGRPIISMYVSDFTAGYDQAAFDHVYDSFAADFAGIRPWIIRDTSWRNVTTDSITRWGAALKGPTLLRDGIASVGPGFDNTAVPTFRQYRSRENGHFYRSGWWQIIRHPYDFRIVHIETWNEMHEATNICECVEYGRSYIPMTAHYVKRFKALKVVAVDPAPAAVFSPRPAALKVFFNKAPDPATVHPGTFRLQGSGGDGDFSGGNEIEVTAGRVHLSGLIAEYDLTGYAWPQDTYRIILKGTGSTPIRAADGAEFDGTFTGVFPSGDEAGGGDFLSTFVIRQSGDADRDDDVDLDDFGAFQRCLTGWAVPANDPTCDWADLDRDTDIDHHDLTLLRGCMSGQGITAHDRCVP